MPLDTHTDQSKRLTVFTGKGELSFDEIQSAIKSFYNGGPTHYVLWDMSDATANSISHIEIREIVGLIRMSRKGRKGGKTAIVAASDVDFGLSRMLQILLESPEELHQVWLEVFRSKDEAVQWLNEKTESVLHS